MRNVKLESTEIELTLGALLMIGFLAKIVCCTIVAPFTNILPKHKGGGGNSWLV